MITKDTIIGDVIKENPNIMIPGVKFSSLYVSPGIFICWNINNKKFLRITFYEI